MDNLTGKKVFITGAEQGIGRATAEQLIQAGCDIYLYNPSGEVRPESVDRTRSFIRAKSRL